MPRSRAVLTAPIVLAIIAVGVFAIRSRGADNADLDTDNRKRCAPVARADAVATTPATPVAVDVLANDTDADGDQLVVQIIKATGGTALIDDAATPFDPDDDRVVFTPADPAPTEAVVEYQAVDPDGATGAAVLTVFVNAEATVPAGVTSASADGAARQCGGTATPSTAPGTTVRSPATTVDAPGASVRPSGRTQPRAGDTVRRTTTTTRRPTATPTTRPAPPPTTRPPSGPTTTRPSGPPPTTPPQCGPFPAEGSDAQQEAWADCVERNSRP